MGSVFSDLMNLAGQDSAQSASDPYAQSAGGIYQGLFNQASNTPLATGDTAALQSELSSPQTQTEDEALNRLMSYATNGGMTATDKANMQLAQDSALSASRGQAGATENEMAARGLEGSGLQYQTDQASQGNVYNSINQADMGAASAASQRQLSALNAAGSLAGQMRTQDWGERSQAAQAQDMLNEFNRNSQMQTGGNYANWNMGAAQRAYDMAMQRWTMGGKAMGDMENMGSWFGGGSGGMGGSSWNPYGGGMGGFGSGSSSMGGGSGFGMDPSVTDSGGAGGSSMADFGFL